MQIKNVWFNENFYKDKKLDFFLENEKHHKFTLEEMKKVFEINQSKYGISKSVIPVDTKK